MKRWFSTGAAVVLSGIVAGSAAAQDTPGARMAERTARYRQEKERVAAAEFLIFDRAQTRARQRAARLEMYRWLGYAPTRPTVPQTAFNTDQNPGLYYSWSAGAARWAGRW